MKTLTLRTLKTRFTKLGKEGYTLEIDGLVGKLWRNSKRAKGGLKKVFAYRFRNEQQMIDYINEQYNRILKDEQKVLDRKDADKKVADSVKVGDLFIYSWGWEQTQVDAYQVVARKGKSSLVIRPVSIETVEKTSWASANVKAVKDSFIGSEEVVRLNGSYFKRPCGYARKREWNETFYNSWYA